MYTYLLCHNQHNRSGIGHISHRANYVESEGVVINYGKGGGGSIKTGGGGASDVLPLQKGGMRKVLAILKWGGGTKRFVVVLTRVLEVLTILEGGGGAQFL